MMAYHTHISINPEIRFGKPCIRGTRIAIADILGWLANNMSFRDILDDFPILKEEHILTALAFAAHRETISQYVFSNAA